MSLAKPLRLRLFLEGIEVPVIAAQVSIGMSSPAVASIQVVPLDSVRDLKPRTMVHLFFLDQYKVLPNPGDNGLDTLQQQDLKLPDFLKNYRLLFSGELHGFAYSKSPAGRAVVLQCVDFSSYWDSAQATAIEYGPNGNLFSNTGAVNGSNTSVFDDIANQEPEKLVQWIKQSPITPGLTGVAGLAGGIIHMLEAMGGVPDHFNGVNDFFSFAELRCRILAQIAAEETDSTAANLLANEVFDEWLRNGLQNIGQHVSFRDMVKLLMQYIYYETVANPVARYTASTPGTVTSKTTTSPISQLPFARSAISELQDNALVILQSLIAQENLTIPETLNYLKGADQSIKRAITTISNSSVVNTGSVQGALGLINAADRRIASLTATPPSSTDSILAPNILELVRQAIFALQNASQKGSSSTTSTTNSVTSRLRTQIIRPDCWFVPPPKCNVIFPEQYTQFSYERSYMVETTRMMLMLYQSIIGPDKLLSEYILAPNIANAASAVANKTGSASYRVLMDHELHTGIIDRFQRVSNITAGTPRQSGANQKNLKGYRLTWTGHIALYHFFKFRFGPRQASISGRFNPGMVCGFPALVIDKPFNLAPNLLGATDQETLNLLQTQKYLNLAPDQFVGMVGNLTHNVDQVGGTTGASLHHVHKHKGIDDEFVRVFTQTNSTNTQRVRVYLNADSLTEDQDHANLLLLSDLTPQISPPPAGSTYQFVKQVQQVIVLQSLANEGADAEAQNSTNTKTITVRQVVKNTNNVPPLTNPNGTIVGLNKKPVSIPSPPGKKTVGSKGVFGKIAGVQVVDPTLRMISGVGQVFSSVVVYEDVTVPLTQNIPFEELVFPSWFSTSYKNENISKNIYQPFFGCDAITESLRIQTDPNSPTGNLVSVLPPSPPQAAGMVVSPSAGDTLESITQQVQDDAAEKAGMTTERAGTLISYLYGVALANNADIDQFIRSYNDRPIASMVDMLGSPDLQIGLNSDGTINTVVGTLGFHSLAVNPTCSAAGNLAGLLNDPNLLLKRINKTGSSSPLQANIDVRLAKQQPVQQYVLDLQKRAFRG